MIMSTDSQHVIDSFNALPAVEQRHVIAQLLLSAARWDTPPLSDDELVCLAEETFLEMDRREAADGN